MSDINVITVDGHEFNARRNLGQTVAIKPVEYRPSIPTVHGVRPAYKVDVLVLSGPDEGLYFDQVLLFQKGLIAQLRDKAGSDDPTLLGALTEVPVFEGSDNQKFVVAEATTADIRIAAKYGV